MRSRVSVWFWGRGDCSVGSCSGEHYRLSEKSWIYIICKYWGLLSTKRQHEHFSLIYRNGKALRKEFNSKWKSICFFQDLFLPKENVLPFTLNSYTNDYSTTKYMTMFRLFWVTVKRILWVQEQPCCWEKWIKKCCSLCQNTLLVHLQCQFNERRAQWIRSSHS